MVYDKGNKEGLGCFVTMVSWYRSKTKKIQITVLDIDAANGTSVDVVKGIDRDLKKLDD